MNNSNFNYTNFKRLMLSNGNLNNATYCIKFPEVSIGIVRTKVEQTFLKITD